MINGHTIIDGNGIVNKLEEDKVEKEIEKKDDQDPKQEEEKKDPNDTDTDPSHCAGTVS